MFSLRLAAAALGAVLAFSASGQAATVVSGVVYEGGVAPASGAPRPDIRLGDFDATAGDPLLSVVGDVSIWGGVAHRRISRYTDAWAMDFGTDVYAGSFNWQNTRSNPFDGILQVGDETYTLGNNGSIFLDELSGVVSFVVDPRAGNYAPNPDEVATWDLQLTEVPLPAGGWLLLSGLAGMCALKRRRKRG